MKMFTLLGESHTRSWALLAFYVIASWMVWGWLFFRVFREQDPTVLSRRLTTWLLRGSVLQLLVAVPTHVVVRQRGDCCAPAATFWGIAAGLTVMLMSFGPGVFFLYAERRRRLKPSV